MSNHGLKNHTKTCGNENLIKCYLCDKTFGHLSNLKTHIKVVHERQKFKCEKCQETFKTMEKLKNHDQFQHNPVYHYKCNICIKAFTGEHNLLKHKSQAHKKCQFCDESFEKIDDVFYHVKSKHAEEMSKNEDSDSGVTSHKEVTNRATKMDDPGIPAKIPRTISSMLAIMNLTMKPIN